MEAKLVDLQLPESFDLALVVSPYGGYPISRLQYLRTAQQLSLPRPHLKPAMPVIGGGVHPGTVDRFVGELGSDSVLGVGGAIQGHPDGAAAGVRAMRQAVDAALAGVTAGDAASDPQDLRPRSIGRDSALRRALGTAAARRTCLELWGTSEPT